MRLENALSGLAWPILTWLGFGLYLANVALGLGVQWRLVSTRRVRWVHHSLYGLVFASALLAGLSAVLSGRFPWPLLVTLGALALMPRYRGGSRPHSVLAALGLAGYAGVLGGVALS